MNKKNLLVLSVMTYVIATTVGYFATTSVVGNMGKSGGKTADSTPAATEKPSEPRTEECPINGAMYGKSAKAKWVTRRPLAVVIENHEDSRPQSGISSADVVYEAVSEGGVTRTLSMFYCQDAKPVGPIRSARVHFINLLREWGNNPLYAHVGGANCDATTGSGCGNGAPADALGLLRKLEWKVYNDMDQFSISYPYYYRDYDRLPDVATEHTVYSSTEKLWEFAAKNRELTEVDADGLAWNETWKPWKFVDEAPTAKRGTTKYISYDFYDTNAQDYGVSWEYDSVANVYKRSNGGKPHIDNNTQEQLTAKNVFVMLARESGANDDYPGGHIVYDLLDEGDAYMFQNGQVIEGTWEKGDFEEKVIFTDSKGVETPIVRGTVWISLLPAENEVYYGAAPKSKPQSKQTTGKVTTPANDE